MSNTIEPDTGSSMSSLPRGGITDTGMPANVSGWAKALTLGRNMDARKSGSATERWARNLVFSHLSKMQRGSLALHEDTQTSNFGKVVAGTDNRPINAVIDVHQPPAYTSIAFNGVVGAAEGYMDGYWSSPDLLSVVRFFVSNITALKKMDSERSTANRIALGLLNSVTRNSLTGSRKNISAHYDLGNDFFELFLDRTMMYSSAWFDNKDITLEQASIAKLQLICEKLALQDTDHLIEIGTGWGGMALYAATNYGCKVTTTTLSKQQFDFATALVKEHGLENQITVLLKDYRELDGEYDKLVSIEMIEAVGHKYFSDYFNKCNTLLKPDGLMLLQAITIPDQRYEQARRSVDFIQRYIFPGGCLPSLSVIAHHVSKVTDMNVVSVDDLTNDYAKTLEHWHREFETQLDKVRTLGFDERFIKMWRYYLCYCQGGFMERVINSTQVVLAKPDYRTC